MATPVNETKGMSHNNHQVEMNGYACNETKVCLAVTVKWLRMATPVNETKVCLAVTVKWLRMATPVNETKGMSRSYSQVVKDGYAR